MKYKIMDYFEFNAFASYTLQRYISYAILTLLILCYDINYILVNC